jgi:hypothetical protein
MKHINEMMGVKTKEDKKEDHSEHSGMDMKEEKNHQKVILQYFKIS